MDRDLVMAYRKALETVQTLTDRMAESGEFGASWAVRTYAVIDDMLDYLDGEEDHNG